MNEEEYKRKYLTVTILKSIQEYLKTGSTSKTAVYPIKVPHDLLYDVLEWEGPEEADKLIDYIFKFGLRVWSEKKFSEVFGSSKKLEEFVELVKKRKREEKHL